MRSELHIPIQLDAGAIAPKRATTSDAGYDLHAIGTYLIDPNQRSTIRTGIRLAIPEGYYGRIAPRSGLAVKNGIQVLAGVIDAGYRGEILVCLHNSGAAPLPVATGDRIAQIIFERCHSAEFAPCETLPASQRGEGGFGSSGTN